VFVVATELINILVLSPYFLFWAAKIVNLRERNFIGNCNIPICLSK